MKKPKLTPWFPAGTKPARAGVYQAEWGVVSNPDGSLYAHWNGINWGYMDESIGGAKNYRHQDCTHDAVSLQWRGLAVKP